MSDKTKNILRTVFIVIATAALTYFASDYLVQDSETIHTDSTTTVSEIKVSQQNEISTVLRTQIKAQLLDSLKSTLKEKLITVYKDKNINVDSLFAEAKKQFDAELKDSIRSHVFTITGDTIFVLKDSSGRMRDSLEVYAECVSPIPLHSATAILLSARLFSFSYDKHIDTRTETIRTITKKSLLDYFRPGLIVAYGYGIKNSKWDLFVGAGANIDIQELLKSFQEE